jgi:cerevisin
MRVPLSAIFASLAFLTFASSAPATAAGEAQQATGDTIVILDPSITGCPTVDRLLGLHNLTASDASIAHIYDNAAFRGLSATLNDSQLSVLKTIPCVISVQADSPLFVTSTRTNTPWNLERVSASTQNISEARARELIFTYRYEGELGDGVDIYIIDSGVNVAHNQFGGRATMGFSTYSSATDIDGHGTHVAGIAGGATLGLASNANIIGIKALEKGVGSTASVTQAFNYVVKTHNTRRSQAGFVASVVNLSLGEASQKRNLTGKISLA